MSEVFKKLSAINVSGITEKKGNLTYLSWAHAWAEASKLYSVTRTVYKNESGRIYHDDGNSAWVEVGVEIEGVEYVDYLPIMDYRNNAIDIDNITMMDVNKAIQRSTTKALALHGLAINVYAGEDLPMTLPELPADKVPELIEWAVNNGKSADVAINAFSKKYEISEEQKSDITKGIVDAKL